MKRTLALLLALTAAVAAPGCGLGEGEEQAGAGASLSVTRDFGRERLGEVDADQVREDETVMRLLESRFEVEKRYGGRFVQAIDGVEGRGAGGVADWFFFVNGVESEVGAAEYELSPGDRVQWDYRDWGAAMRVPAIVGAFPEPFLHGLEGERRPVRVECDDSESTACQAARDTLEREGISTSGSSLGAPGTETIFRLAVARWPAARIVRGASGLEDGPETTGVFVRFAEDGRSFELLNARGESVRTVRPGDGVGLILAMRPLAEEIVWLVTALDDAGLEAAVSSLDSGRLRDAFAVAVDGGEVERLPLP